VADNQVTLVGNITDDPELRFTPSGSAVANFTVAVNRRIRQGDRWEDKLDGFFNCSCWRDMAENAAESLRKGTRVVVVGRLNQRSWEDREGNRRTAVELQVDEVAPSLRWATAQIQKSQRSSGGAPQQGGGSGGGAGSESGGGAGSGSGGGDDWSAPANVPSGPPSESPTEGGF
jgi:single-strand DNA-binding protein